MTGDIEKIKRDKKRNTTLFQGFEEFKEFKKRNNKRTIIHYKNAFDKIRVLGDKPIGYLTTEIDVPPIVYQ